MAEPSGLRDRLLCLRDSLREGFAAADAFNADLPLIVASVDTALATLACEHAPGKPNEGTL